MKRTTSPILAVALFTGFAVLAGATAAKSSLRDEPTVTEGLIAVAIAYELSERCDDLSARRLAGINYLWGLRGEAERLGYSDAEIDAFVEDDAEKDRLEGIARARLTALGVVEGQEATYCAVGRAEISGGTAAGALLR